MGGTLLFQFLKLFKNEQDPCQGTVRSNFKFLKIYTLEAKIQPFTYFEGAWPRRNGRVPLAASIFVIFHAFKSVKNQVNFFEIVTVIGLDGPDKPGPGP